MKKLFVLMLASLFTVTALTACGDSNDAVTNDDEVNTNVEQMGEAEEELPEGWTYSAKKIVGAWESRDMMTGVYYGYRFNEDGTLDSLYNRMYEPVGVYECKEDGIHYSPDGGTTWDPLVMIIKSQSDTEMTIEFDGIETVLTRYDGELTEYMPDGWTYVEGTDEEIDAATGAEEAE